MKDNFKDDTFLARWLNGQLSDEELAEFESHKDYELYKKIASTTADFQVPDRNKQKGWEALNEKMTASVTPTKVRTIGNWWKYIAAAAAILLVSYFTFFQSDNLKVYSTPMASQEIINLPDGSTVTLNADSKLSYNPQTFLAERNLNLEGEAFFSVQKGERFTVQTKNGDVRVLGTSFNVDSRKNRIDLTCFTGKVGLSFNQFNEMEVLNPGDRIIAKNQKVTDKIKSNFSYSKPSWIDGLSRFEQVDFIEVIESLERQFDIVITYPDDIKSLPKYNGGFPHDNLKTALDIVFSSIGYQYEINGKQIVVVK